MITDTTYTYTPADFVRAFGAAEADGLMLEAATSGMDLRYRRLNARTREAVILDIEERIATAKAMGDYRRDVWERCWSDVALRFTGGEGTTAELTPPFLSRLPVLRLDGDFARPLDAAFESQWQKVLRLWLSHAYLAEAPVIYEFGCGSGHNLVDLAGVIPTARFIGLDWSPSAAALVSAAGARLGLPLEGRVFDFFAPDPGLRLEPGAVVLTFFALEQVGERCGPFIEWLTDRRPALVISIEPLLEFYDPTNPFDRLALAYHRARGYLSGYLPRLRRLEMAGKVSIVKACRTGFGSTYNEGCSLLVWRPS